MRCLNASSFLLSLSSGLAFLQTVTGDGKSTLTPATTSKTASGVSRRKCQFQPVDALHVNILCFLEVPPQFEIRCERLIKHSVVLADVIDLREQQPGQRTENRANVLPHEPNTWEYGAVSRSLEGGKPRVRTRLEVEKHRASSCGKICTHHLEKVEDVPWLWQAVSLRPIRQAGA